MNNSIIFTGKIKKVPVAGDSIKNKYFIDRFRNVYDKVWIVGINKDSWHLYFLPFRLFQLVITAMIHPKARIVVSSNSWEANKIIRTLNFFGMTQRTYFWVVGGNFHKMVGEKYKVSLYKKLKAIYVQSPKMVQEMKQKGFSNVIYVPNSKQINHYPEISNRRQDGMIRFVFLSRVHPDKGCSQIVECAKRLNENGFEDKFTVDFYGKLFDEYKTEFTDSIKDLSNVNYKGYLDLTKTSGYDVLSQYDVMLFPTWWRGEGFPGIVIDAYVAGLPIIASDWNFNTDVVTEETGVIIPTKDQNRLYEEMLNFVKGKYDLSKMRMKCQEIAHQYDNRQVLSEENLKRIGML
jgi:glycosyltransferase involved in cell wall biosynthesis